MSRRYQSTYECFKKRKKLPSILNKMTKLNRKSCGASKMFIASVLIMLLLDLSTFTNSTTLTDYEVIDQDYDANVGDQLVSAENDALFRCSFLPQVRDFYQVLGWFEDGQHLVAGTSLVQAAQQQQQQQQPQKQTPIILPDGELLIPRVQLKDANKSYRCQYKNLLNSKVSQSALKGRLFVTDSSEQSGSAPRIIDGPLKPITTGKLNEQIQLTCLAQGSPRPQLRWFRQSFNSNDWLELTGGGLGSGPIELNGTNKNYYQLSPDNNQLLIKQVVLGDNRSRFKCLANNTFGMHYQETELVLELFPASKLVELEPQVKFVDNSQLVNGNQRNREPPMQAMVFNCTIRSSINPLIALEWLKNGQLLFALKLPASNQQQLEQAASFYRTNNTLGAQQSLMDDFNRELLAVEFVGREEPKDDNFSEQFGADQEGEFISASGSPYLTSQTTINKLNLEFSSNSFRRRLRQRILIATAQQQQQQLGGNEVNQFVYQLQFNYLKRSDFGSYQCRAKSARTTIEATTTLLLKDNPPEFIETFPSQLILSSNPSSSASLSKLQAASPQPEQGAATFQDNSASTSLQAQTVSLKCIASGSPLPEIKWTLSGFPILEASSRYRIGDYVTRDGLIVSFVNISNVQVEDGGLYECSASNIVGQLRHQAWLNVSGPPYIRPMPNVSAIGGQSLAIMCPVGGWPIEQISWFQNSTKLPVNHRQKLFPNGTLIINELNEVTDNGQYSCQAKAGETIAVNHVRLSVKVPPVVEQFPFAKSLHRGQRYNIMCTVVRGDLPVVIRWFKDSRLLDQNSVNQQRDLDPQPQQQQIGQASANLNQISTDSNPDQGIAIKQLDPYSSTLTFASLQSNHRGLYTCEASNEAGRANQSSALVIHVPPQWKIEPRDLNVIVGRQAIIDCQADAFPAARIEWRLSQDLFREPPTEFKPIISSIYMRVFENGSLVIYNAQRTDAGYYLCQANNNVGPGLSRVIKLTVHVAAHFKSKIRTEVVRKSQPAKLKCEAFGDLPIDINWLKDKMPVYSSDDSRYLISKTLLQDGIISELNILDSNQRLDSARFTCITQNQYGSDDTNIQLIVQGPPDLPQEIQIHEHGARSVKIGWLPAYSGNSPVLKYIILYAPTNPASYEESAPLLGRQNLQPVPVSQQQYNNVSVGGNETSVVLQNLLPLTEYQYLILAVNSIGSSKLPNETIKFQTDDEAPSSPPLFFKAQAASSRSIRVKWRVPERRPHFGASTGVHIGYRLQPSAAPPASGDSQTSANSAGGSNKQASDGFTYKTVQFSYMNETNRSSEQECLIQGLRRGQRYAVFVQAFNEHGSSPASELALVETWRVDVPDPPSLRVVARSAHSIHLAWQLASNVIERADYLAMASQKVQMSSILPGAANKRNINDHQHHHHHHHFKPISGQTRFISPASRPTTTEVGPLAMARSKMARQGMEELSEDSSSSAQLVDLSDSSNDVSDSKLEPGPQLNEPVLGFVLIRKQISSASQQQPQSDLNPVEMRLPGDHRSQIIDDLLCGTRYQFTLSAFNSVGSSIPSDPLVVQTEGSTPIAPDKGSLLSLNSSSVLINLAAWYSGACAMKSFDVAYRVSRSKKWSPLLTNYQVQQEQGSRPSEDSGSPVNANSSALISSQNQLVQRSANQQQAKPNDSFVLDALSASLNYDLKIVATNEAGSTEAQYTFNTYSGILNGPNKLGNEQNELQWFQGQQNQDLSVPEMVFNNFGSIFPWLLFLLFVSLSLSTGCILIARRRHASSSNCSLSLSSASRSNQSSSNYYSSSLAAAATTGNVTGLTNSFPVGSASATLQKLRFPSPNQLDQFQHSSLQHQSLDEEPSDIDLNRTNMMRMGDIYRQPTLHKNIASTVNPIHNPMLSNEQKLNYATYLNQASHYASSAARLRPDSPGLNAELEAAANNESEAEMCLGASALNLAKQANKSCPSDNYFSTEQVAALALKQFNGNKSSTLPANCQHQLLQHYVQQQQQSDSAATSQQIIDTIMTASLMQQQLTGGQIQGSASFQPQQNGAGPSSDLGQLLLDQQLQQQVYATVKRGCPRPPRLCNVANGASYTIYQCPNNAGPQQQQVGVTEQQEFHLLRACCDEMQQQQASNQAAEAQQQICYQQLDQQIADCLQQQQQQSDYQQLRQIT